MQTLIVVGVFMIVEALTFSSFIRSDQKVTPYQLVFFLVMTLKSDFSLIGTGKITLKGSMNTANFWKTSLFVDWDYEQQTSTRLWNVRVNKWFKKCFCGTSILRNLWTFENLLKHFTVAWPNSGTRNFECNYFYEKNWWVTLSFLIYEIICLLLFSWLKIWKFNFTFSYYISFPRTHSINSARGPFFGVYCGIYANIS